MAAALIYRSSAVYELAMMALYGRHYSARYKTIADLIPREAEVLELCCGPGTLYLRYLRQKNVKYRAIDMSEEFARALLRRGIAIELWDLRSERPLPTAEYVIMQGSLYHLLPDAGPMLDRMLEAARKTVIVAEPMRNFARSRFALLRWLSRKLTEPGSGSQARRLVEKELDELMTRYGNLLCRQFLAPGGRDKVYVLEKDLGAKSKAAPTT